MYKVSPIIEDIKTPPVSDLTYAVSPLVEDFNPPGYDKYVEPDNPWMSSETPFMLSVKPTPTPRAMLSPISANTVDGLWMPRKPLIPSTIFNPPGYDKYVEPDNSDDGDPEPDGDGDGNGLRGGPTGGDGGGFTFAPTVPIQITVEGNADREALEELRAQLEAEFEAKMRELFEEFREEEIQRAGLSLRRSQSD